MNRARLERGSGLVEFAFMVPVLMLLALGVFDFGLAIEQGIVVVSAAHAGAEFGAADGNANNTGGMQTAAINSAPGLTSMVATATTWCTCTAGGATVSCSSLCNTYDIPMQYVQVQTSVTVPILIQFGGLPATVPLSGNSIMRAR